MSAILILRAEPGASATAAKVRKLGLRPVVAPLFTVTALDWDAPDPAAFDALLLTSANAARLGGAGLALFRHLPCYCVGEATADAAQAAGFGDVRIGPSDGAAAAAMMVADGMGRALHLCGRKHVALGGAIVERRVVYGTDAAGRMPDMAVAGLAEGALALLHSPRAAALFAVLADRAGVDRASVRLAAISVAAAQAAGAGWAAVAIAPAPRDAALLELAAELCNKRGDR